MRKKSMRCLHAPPGSPALRTLTETLPGTPRSPQRVRFIQPKCLSCASSGERRQPWLRLLRAPPQSNLLLGLLSASLLRNCTKQRGEKKKNKKNPLDANLSEELKQVCTRRQFQQKEGKKKK